MTLAKSLQSAAGNAAEANYIEDVFSTWLYTGNGSTQTITNGIDLAGEGGLVWVKNRTAAYDHILGDTVRGASVFLRSNTTDPQSSTANHFSSFNSNGFSIGSNANVNLSSNNYASWTFRKQEKFFDVVTYTGDDVAGRTVAHNLGSEPAVIIVKSTSAAGDWAVYHRSLGATKYILLNSTAAAVTDSSYWQNTTPTSTEFTLGGAGRVNYGGRSYVAYLFAHNAGGFGLTGEDNVISCGSYTGNGSATGPSINLGYEPQWLLVKNASVSGHYWHVVDTMRGWIDGVGGGSEATLLANTADAENGLTGASNYSAPTSTGFKIESASGEVNTSGATYIYIAIRRPMKVPESGTGVFQPVAYTGTNLDFRLVNTGIVTDMAMARIRDQTSIGGIYTADRLRGNVYLGTAVADAENPDSDSFMTPTSGYGNTFSSMNGFGVGNDPTRKLNGSSTPQLAYAFKRAPGFMDVCCYTGTGVARTVAHNLAAVPELMIVKQRSAIRDWSVYSAATGATNALYLNTTAASSAASIWNSTTPTASVFSLAGLDSVNASGGTYVAYLFASCPGVSKVGSYTGNGATQVINCGFTGGARFVLIKCTTAAESWHVFDTARGMVAGTDPRFRVNTSDSELNNNWVYTATTGFELVTSSADVNSTGNTYIFLAIA